jgi:hypothetical protein
MLNIFYYYNQLILSDAIYMMIALQQTIRQDEKIAPAV